MKLTNSFLYDPNPAGGGGTGAPPSDWRETLPDDIKGSAALANIKDIPSLAKSYVHAQTLIGTDKVAKPQKNWTDKQWSEFYAAVGRPETPDKYTFKPEGLPEGFDIDEERMKAAKTELHNAGLTDAQANRVLKYYLDTTGKQFSDMRTSESTQRQQAELKLKQEWGDNYTQKVDVAQAVFKKFGGAEMEQFVAQHGNNPLVVKLFAAIGDSMMDDSATGSGDGLIVGTPAQSLQEINSLKIDTEFQAALGNRSHPGHKAAVERWEALHAKAYPSK